MTNNLQKNNQRERRRAYQEKHKEHIKAQKAAYYVKNREKFLAQQKDYKCRNRDRVSKWAKDYYTANKVAIRERITRSYMTRILPLKIERGGKCEACGFNDNVRILEWHHTDPASKEFVIGGTWYDHSVEEIRMETSKCVLLCPNCHRNIHNPTTEEIQELVALGLAKLTKV